MSSLTSRVSFSTAPVWLSWKIGGSVHFFLLLPLDFGIEADSPPTRGVSGAIWTGGMALSVDAPQGEAVKWALSWRVAEDDLKLPESEASPSSSGLMVGYAAAAGTGGSGYRSFWSVGCCNSTCMLKLTFSRNWIFASSGWVTVSDVLRELVGCSAPFTDTSSSKIWLFDSLSAL